MRRSMTWLVALGAVALVAAPVLAQGGPHRHHRMGYGDEGFGPFGGPRLERLAMRLDLSDAQREQIHETLMAARESRAEARESLWQARDALAQAIHAELFDEAAIREAAAAVAALEADQAVERGRIAQSVRQILTPEQLEQLDEMRQERPRMRQRRPWRHRHHAPDAAPEG